MPNKTPDEACASLSELPGILDISELGGGRDERAVSPLSFPPSGEHTSASSTKSKYSTLPQLDTTLEYVGGQIEDQEKQKEKEKVRRTTVSKGTVVPPPSILSSDPSNTSLCSASRTLSSVSFRMPKSVKTRGSINVTPAEKIASGTGLSFQASSPARKKDTSPVRAPVRSPVPRRVKTPLSFELPERQHPLQMFSFPDEDSVPNVAASAGGFIRSRPASATASRKQTLTKPKTPKTVIQTPKGPVIPFKEYLSKEDDNKTHILIGVTGSVATIKIPLIIEKLFKVYTHDKVSIQLVVTKAAEHFLRGLKVSSDVKIWRENEQWSKRMERPGDPILHLELRKWADILLIAPMSANSLAKIANGLADNLLTSIVRDWNPSIPIIIAPAMNTFMYTNPMTKKHLAVLQEDFKYIEVLKPIEKVLVCGDIGMGGMREWSEIVDILVRRLKQVKKLERKKLVEHEGDGIENGERDEDDDENGDEDDGDEDDEDEDDEDEDDEDEDDEDDEDDDDDDDDDEDEDVDEGIDEDEDDDDEDRDDDQGNDADNESEGEVPSTQNASSDEDEFQDAESDEPDSKENVSKPVVGSQKAPADTVFATKA